MENNSTDSQQPQRDPHRVCRWQADDVQAFADASRVTTLRSIIPGLVRDGALCRRGKFWYGRPADVEAWLLGQFRAPKKGAH